MKRSQESFRNKFVSDSSISSRKEIASFRNSPKQYVCVEMLQDGYHRAFSELFSSSRLDSDQRAEAPPGSPRLQNPPSEEQREKSETIRSHSSRAEKAEREGSWTAVCKERSHLGRYLSHQKDFWLSLHFYHSCADRECGGRSRPATEARLHSAESYRQRGDSEEARQQAETGSAQAQEGGWSDSEPSRLWACRESGKTYSSSGEALLAARNYDAAKKSLQQGSRMAAECEDKSVEGEVVFRHASGLQRSGDHEAAKQIFTTCSEIFSSLQDVKGVVKTYKAIAKSLESEGNTEETLRSSEKSADICRASGSQDRSADVCSTSGGIYSDTSQPQRACQYFSQGYQAACDAGDVTSVQKAQVKSGSACAGPLIRKHSSDMQSASSTSVRRSVAWKETRGHQDFCSADRKPERFGSSCIQSNSV